MGCGSSRATEVESSRNGIGLGRRSTMPIISEEEEHDHERPGSSVSTGTFVLAEGGQDGQAGARLAGTGTLRSVESISLQRAKSTLYQVKLLIVGPYSVGKTSLAYRLSGQAFQHFSSVSSSSDQFLYGDLAPRSWGDDSTPLNALTDIGQNEQPASTVIIGMQLWDVTVDDTGYSSVFQNEIIDAVIVCASLANAQSKPDVEALLDKAKQQKATVFKGLAALCRSRPAYLVLTHRDTAPESVLDALPLEGSEIDGFQHVFSVAVTQTMSIVKLQQHLHSALLADVLAQDDSDSDTSDDGDE
eukprot:m.115319 g.115319  ORF g.115319 m.115319 type:complete len:302 (-) comp13556_c0_seq11:288-1193(-)